VRLTGQGDGSAVSTALTPLAPDTSTNLQAGYEFLMRNLGDFAIVSTLADLDHHFPESGGVRTIDKSVIQTGTVTVPNDQHLLFVSGGAWTGLINATLLGNCAGGLMRGLVEVQVLTLGNLHPSGEDVAVTSPLGEPIIIASVNMIGTSAGTVTTAVGVIDISRIALLGGAGLTFTGGLGIVSVQTCFMSMSAAGAVGITLAAGATVGVSFNVSGSSFATSEATQKGISLSDSATVPAPAFRLTDNTASGPGELLDSTAGHFGTTDLEVIAANNTGTPNSVIRIEAAFSDLDDPVNVSEALGDWGVIPWESLAGTGVLAAQQGQARVEIIDTATKGPLQPGVTPGDRWSIRVLGPLTTGFDPRWRATLKLGGGSSYQGQCQLEFDAGGVGTWVGLDATRSSTDVASRYEQMEGEGRVDVVNPLDEFRLVHRGTDAASNADFGEFAITGPGEM
jgi:hypothetical protein